MNQINASTVDPLTFARTLGTHTGAPIDADRIVREARKGKREVQRLQSIAAGLPYKRKGAICVPTAEERRAALRDLNAVLAFAGLAACETPASLALPAPVEAPALPADATPEIPAVEAPKVKGGRKPRVSA